MTMRQTRTRTIRETMMRTRKTPVKAAMGGAPAGTTRMMILITTRQADGAQGLRDSRMPRRTEEGVAGEDGVRWLAPPDYVYIVHGSPSPSPSESSSSPPHAQHRTACTMALTNSNSHATAQLSGSMSQDAINDSPQTQCRPAMTFPCNTQMAYGLRPRPRKPLRRDPLLTACHDALPPELLRHVLLLRVAMPHNYHLRSRRHGCSTLGADLLDVSS